jgi:hypothetical protein
MFLRSYLAVSSQITHVTDGNRSRVQIGNSLLLLPVDKSCTIGANDLARFFIEMALHAAARMEICGPAGEFFDRESSMFASPIAKPRSVALPQSSTDRANRNAPTADRAREKRGNSALGVSQARPTFDFARIPVFLQGPAEWGSDAQIPPAPRFHSPIQAELRVGAVNDPLEREADRVAQQVLQGSLTGSITKCPAGIGDATRFEASSARPLSVGEQAPDSVHQALSSPGKPLDVQTRSFMEPRFGFDFSRVRIHTDGRAAESAHYVKAHAYTVGKQIVFGAGEFAPETRSGQRLIAHELTHVVQQQSAGSGAVTLQRDTNPKAGDAKAANFDDPSILFEIYMGDGKHQPNDVSFATKVGKLDARNVRAAGSVSGGTKLDVKAKIKYFQPPARHAYIRQVLPALREATPEDEIEMTGEEKATVTPVDRDGLRSQIGNYMLETQMLKDKRLETWKMHEDKDEAKPSSPALEIAITIVSGGIGGVVGGLLADTLIGSAAVAGEEVAAGAAAVGAKAKASHSGHNPYEEFTYLAGLEAADQASHAAFHHAIDVAKETLSNGDKKALKLNKEKNAQIAVAATKPEDGLLECYAEAVTLQSSSEEIAELAEFDGLMPKLSDIGLIGQFIIYGTLYEQISMAPDLFMRELSVGYITLKDEHFLEKDDKKFGGDRARHRQAMYEGLGPGWRQPGNLHIEMADMLDSAGDWGHPNLDFQLIALAAGIHGTNLGELLDTPIEELPLSMDFMITVTDPFYRIAYGSRVAVSFGRDPEGKIYRPSSETGGLEWLASYYLGVSRELTDEERIENAPKGARKLYDAIKNKKLTKVESLED